MIVVKPATEESTSFLSHIAVIALDRNEITPPEFTILEHTPSGKDANLNFGSKGKLTYLCVRYLKQGLRITSLTMVPQLQKEMQSDSFRLRTTVGGADATLGEKSKEPYQLCFSKDWSSLMLTPSCLRSAGSCVAADPIVVPEATTNSISAGQVDSMIPVDVSESIPTALTNTAPISAMPLTNSVIPEESPSETHIESIHTETIHDSLNMDTIPSGFSHSLDLDEIPITEPSIDSVVIRQTAAAYRNQTRNLLPLLIGCHCGDSAITRICVEHLYHFIDSQPVETPGGLQDLSTEVVLNCIYEGTLSTLSVSVDEIQSLLIKIVGYFQVIPQTTLALLLRIFSSLTLYLFRLEDHSLTSSQHYDKVNIGLRSIVSLIPKRTQPESEKNSVPSTSVNGSIMEDVLASYAYKLESPGALLAGEMIDDMIDVCDRLSGSLYEQNMILFLLALLGDLRRYGRVRNSSSLSISNITSSY